MKSDPVDDVGRYPYSAAHRHSEAVTIRLASPADAQPLRRLAALDSGEVPAGELLLAELDGVLVAAVALTGDAVIADPFRRTADVVVLLRARVAQLRRENTSRNRGRRRLLWSRLRRTVRTASAV